MPAKRHPIFYDASGNRRRWLIATLSFSAALLATAAIWTWLSVSPRPTLDCARLPDDLRIVPPSEDFTDEQLATTPVVFKGEGEILAPRVAPGPTFATAAEFRRSGGGDPEADPRLVLTFDDGPDPVYTPQILDILQQYHVPAVFFVVGKYAEAHPELIRRIVREGHEIGNHSFAHPDLFKVSSSRQETELALTQRIIQALTGHSTVLFRPPYGGNPDPQEPTELVPMLRAARSGYLTVGEGIIPRDWETAVLEPGVHPTPVYRALTGDDIADRVLRSRTSGHIILLHDAGGDRHATVASLPRIISELRAAGSQFVSLADLCGVPREALNPPVAAHEFALVTGNRAILGVTLPIQRILGALFIFATGFGLFRIVFLLILVLVQRPREKRRRFSPDYTPTVTIIMAAYNEETVIVRSVSSLLRSDYPALDIVVVNDGSTDGTLRLLRKHFGDDARIRILDQRNAGKMAAMNRALSVAEGEILVLADADTLFPPNAVRLMARHFVDPAIGAVAAGVRIGNASDSLLTRWQALEYSTCQNFDRRGLDLLNCIPVIAGAAGAVRREAIVAIGGFSPDTLNEDMDMTWQLIRSGWRIVNDSESAGYTEAPNTWTSFVRQRFRWAYGTLQCLWKHRDALGHYGTLGWVGLPLQWLHQALMPLLAPFVDAIMIFALATGHFGSIARFGLIMLFAEGVAATVALITGGGNLRLLPWLPFQRLGYHPFMWYVVVKAFFTALAGSAVGWNKFARAGTAELGGDGASVELPEAAAATPTAAPEPALASVES
jgi:cellulose synthase/poly-beta-1,6-N-acetylglucosamine synthase-like glycosyltransferase/peptidoglycan/xylan/chitin deacetylase (PgdA/CDA1 family)